MKNKPWDGRFQKTTDVKVTQFTASVSFDARLFESDVFLNLAHSAALQKARVLSVEEGQKIKTGLKKILEKWKKGKINLNEELEDVHLNLESLLEEEIGSLAGKLHTGKSRNDQVATDLRFYLKEKILEILEKIKTLREIVVTLASKNLDTILPGYTHLQRAQPVLLAHQLMAYEKMFTKDGVLFGQAFDSADCLVLGSGALAGVNYQLARKFIAKKLGFSRISENSLEAVSDRDFVLEFIFAASVLMMHLSRLGEDLILWATEEFGFVELDDAYATGSSIMPQKKNPDVLELLRGKAGRVFGHLMGLLTVLKGLPLSYNRDLQEDKEAVFDTVDTVIACLEVLAGFLKSVKFKKNKMLAAAAGFLTAVDLADYLVEKGVPFREAHKIIGRIVRYCLEKDKNFTGLSLDELKNFHQNFEADALKVFSPASSVRKKNLKGGTSPVQVKRAIAEAKRRLKNG
jgi:argininosuccinate lyase